ncbi:DEAD/DEAH box helicase [Silvibacterium dinghuense]|uniref:DEAD/DEAH box helicase n=1 Tax=Silvibacterium dinghuense TaxID=1560006 RepID=A0A4Q1SI24_9BACT|nr:DEAD/DEAH box helicase [Silvibacterium dinghuense]RXS97013.1 DEAD/DEAH box helicase [Silvibacterium dinghuense]GGG95500.1 DEAD/DEAH box helicase [Silvibacterium dinghuense]
MAAKSKSSSPAGKQPASRAKGRPALDEAAVAGQGDTALALFHPVTAAWFRAVFGRPTAPQRLGWPAIAGGESTLILAPTGTGKTLTAFLWCLDRLMLRRTADEVQGCRVIYISPLKALAVDVERNLRSPLAGIEEMAQRMGVSAHIPEIGIRTGDTAQRERARFRRNPAEILITTPESLYLLLTSESAAQLRTVETVIIDEIHALVPTKRGAHLALSLERLEAITAKPVQRIGLSATQRPLEEVAHFLAGVEPSPKANIEDAGLAVSSIVSDDEPAQRFRPVTIVDASEPKHLELRVEVPVEDMAHLSIDSQGQMEDLSGGAASQAPKRTSIWSAIHPRLLEIVLERQSTLIFVNNRRTAERLAGALNDLAQERAAEAGEPFQVLARAHHGSLAASQRSEIEEQLKAGNLRALVATSSLELGIDMGAIDLVIQIEAPPSVASGMQRIGRAGHRVGAASDGIIFPKYRADLIACAAVTRAMHEGLVESTRYLRNPLDVLAQQIVATVAHPPALAVPRRRGEAPAQAEIGVESLFRLVRSSAPFASLTRASFEGVLDLLAGRYPSDEFAELRPRITWDRAAHVLTPREGAKSLAILNGGTIPDRGLYGVFLSGTDKPVRVGELDEEMVFESRAGEVFVLGASSWRIDEITHDRVLVSPAPGEPGKMPFWHGDQAGRPLEFGRRIGALVRELRELPRNAALSRLTREHDLDLQAAENLLHFLADQETVTTVVPDDRSIVIERTRDELGDWRVCVLTPFGTRVHAPWAMAITARLRAAGQPDVETMWADDGFVIRFPDTDAAPDSDLLLIDPAEATDLVLRQLGSTALFAAKFREASARALLLPRRRAQGRAPLWAQRKRASDLLAVAARYSSFPMLLEAYRECLRDVFDIPAFLEVLRAVKTRQLGVHVVDTRTPSPFASSLLFSYVANYIYEGDAPLAERRAQALSIDQDQLRDLLGDADLRELLDADAIAEVEDQLQLRGESFRVRNVDGIHDLLLRLGDLTREAVIERLASSDLISGMDRLLRARRILEVKIAGEKRLIAIEDAARYRDALGLRLPSGIAASLLVPVAAPALELIRRYARTHGPFTLPEVATRFGLDARLVESTLHALVLDSRIVEGGFRPGGVHREWCDLDVLRQIRRKSLARLRKEIEPADQRLLSRFATHWQGVLQPRRGLDALLDTIENLQGAPLPASILESSILPARLAKYSPSDLDTLIAAGEVVWCGLDPLGEHDGRIALYLADRLPDLLPARPGREANPLTEKEERILDQLQRGGAMFFAQLHDAIGGGYPGETLDALWSLVWRGFITNDTLHALRAYVAKPASARTAKRQHNVPVFRSRRTTPPAAQGRWTLIPASERSTPAEQTAWSHALALQLLNRHGILTRETLAQENIFGGFSAVYDVLRALEESGRVRRGYFIAGLGAAQFALPAAVDLLRSLRTQPDKAEILSLSATDPASVYGSILRWPQADADSGADSSPRSLTRSVGASVLLRNGDLVAYLRRGNTNIQVFLPADEPDRSTAARDLAHFLAHAAQASMQHDATSHHSGLLIATINGQPVHEHFLARFLVDAGFAPAPNGFNVRRISPSVRGHAAETE